MLRVHRSSGALTLVSRLARGHVLGVLAGVLGGAALAARSVPGVAAAFAVAALLLVVLGGRAMRARFERGRVVVRDAVPLRPIAERPLAEFVRARVETLGDERRRKAERLARAYRERSGAEMPVWLRAPDTPGRNDHLRRIVLVPPAGDPFAVTAWLADDDLDRVREEIETLLR
jgi:hypothetical protein